MDRESAYEIYRHNREVKQKKKRRAAIKRRVFFFLVFVILGGSVYMLYTADIFKIAEITCTGNSMVSTEEIIAKAGIKLGDNLFMSNIKRASENIADISYVDDFKIWRTLPNKINIRVAEAIPIAYIGNEGNLWVVDKNGKLLENVEEYDPNRGMPLLTGIIVENCKLGDVLYSSRNELLSKGLKCAEILKNLGMLSKTNEINVESIGDIKISYDNRIYMYMGEFDTFEYKIEFVKDILDDKKITDYEHAVLNYRTDKLYVGNEDMFTKDTGEENKENLEGDSNSSNSETDSAEDNNTESST